MSTIVDTTTPAPVVEKDELTLNREAALAWAQEMGYEGHELPKGRRRTVDECVIARALGGRVYGNRDDCGRVWLSSLSPVTRIVLPQRVSEFTFDFDRGLYPDLIAL